MASKEDSLGRGFWAGLEAASRLTLLDHARFQRERALINDELASMFRHYDLLLTPTLPCDAFAARGPMPTEIDGSPLESPMHAVAFTYPFNLSGHPAATIRAGFSRAGLPVGLQIVNASTDRSLVIASICCD